jgi:type IV secretion system protein VirB6
MSLQSWSQLTTGQAAKHALKVAIVLSIATHWDLFSTFMYTAFTNGPNELSAVLIQALGGDNAGSVNNALQTAFNNGVAIGSRLWNAGGFTVSLAAVAVWIANFFVAGIALLELAVAKLGLAITLVLAPIFAACLLWEGSKGIFDRWLSTVLGFAFLPLVVSSTLLVVNVLIQEGIDQITSALSGTGAKFSCIAAFILGSIVSIGLLWKAGAIAANIASGLSISSLGVISQRLRNKHPGKESRLMRLGKVTVSGASEKIKGISKIVGSTATAKYRQLRNR